MASDGPTVHEEIARGLKEHPAKKGMGFNLAVTLVEVGGAIGLFQLARRMGASDVVSYLVGSIGPVLGGLAIWVKAHKLSVAALSGIPIAAGTDGLGTAAIAATEKLAAAAGHPLPSNAASASVTLGAPAASVDFACETLIVLCALAALGVSVAVVARRRRQGDARTATARASR